jgi:hypothetical protein
MAKRGVLGAEIKKGLDSRKEASDSDIGAADFPD